MTIKPEEPYTIGKCSVKLCFAEQAIPGNEKTVLSLLMQSYADRMRNRVCTTTDDA